MSEAIVVWVLGVGLLLAISGLTATACRFGENAADPSPLHRSLGLKRRVVAYIIAMVETAPLAVVIPVLVATRAVMRPQRSMQTFVTVAAWFALSWFILVVREPGDASKAAGWLVADGTIALPFVLGWFSRVPDDGTPPGAALAEAFM